MKVAFFAPNLLGKRARDVDRAEIYEMIKGPDFEEVTRQIQERHRAGILEGFKSIPKTAYQNEKKRRLSAVCFTGPIDRSEDIPADLIHSGIISFDADGNDIALQRLVLKDIQAGKFPYIEAAGLSVSGLYTGDFFFNLKCEFPAPSAKLSGKLLELLGLDAKADHVTRLIALHKAYHAAISSLFLEKYNFVMGKANDLKRCRYIAADRNFHVDMGPDYYGLAALAVQLAKIAQQTEKIQTFEASANNIVASDAFDFAEQFAANKGYKFEPGERHNFRNHIAIACNLLGVPRSEAEAYITAKYPEGGGGITTNCIAGPYSLYREAFGVWRHRLKTADRPADYSFTLAPGERVSDYGERIASIISDHKQTELIAGINAGKNFATYNVIAPALKKINGGITVVVTSLNAKAEKDGVQYGLPVITGASMEAAGLQKSDLLKKALASNIILTSQPYAPRLIEFFGSKGIRVNCIIDEMQSLVTGHHYKPETVSNLFRKSLSACLTVTLMTGTPKPYFREMGFCRIEILKPDRKVTTLVVRDRTPGSPAVTALNHYKAESREDILPLFKIQSRKEIRISRSLFQSELSIPEEKTLAFFSDRNVKAGPDYKRFITTDSGGESFREDVLAAWLTSFAGEGLDGYSTDRALQFVNIEKATSFDVCALVQLDRWRTDSEKTMYTYHPKSDKAPAPDFCEIERFRIEAKHWEREAEHLNDRADSLSRICADSEIINLRTEYSAAQNFIYYSNESGRFEVNLLAIAADVDAKKVRATNVDRGLEEIRKKYPYIKVVDERSTASPDEATDTDTDTDELKEAVKAIDNDLKEQRKAAQATLIDLFGSDRETLFQAVSSASEDNDLRRRIDFHEDRKDSAEALKIIHSDIFTDWLPDCERIVKRFCKARDLCLSDSDIDQLIFVTDDDDDRRVFVSAEKFGRFVTGYRLQLATFLLKQKAKRNLTTLQFADAVATEQVVSALEAAGLQKGRMTSSEIQTEVEKLAGHMSPRKAVTFLKLFFEVRRVTGTQAAYEIGPRLSFEDYLKREGLNFGKVCENVLKRL